MFYCHWNRCFSLPHLGKVLKTNKQHSRHSKVSSNNLNVFRVFKSHHIAIMAVCNDGSLWPRSALWEHAACCEGHFLWPHREIKAFGAASMQLPCIVSAHGRGIGIRQSIRSFPTQTTLWFSDYSIFKAELCYVCYLWSDWQWDATSDCDV